MTILVLIVCVTVVATAFFNAVKAQAKGTNKDHYDEDAAEIAEMILKAKPFTFGSIAIITVVIGLFSSIYSTTEQQVGFTSTFGQNSPIETAGIHLKLPFVSEKHIFDGTTRGMPIGYTEVNDESVVEDSLMITSDFNFLNIDFFLEYRITDPIAYYYSTSDPEGLLQNITLAAVRNTVGQVDVDSAMTTGKSQIEADVFTKITEELCEHNTGLTVTNISIQDSEAPTNAVQAAFQGVEDAKQKAKTAVNEADKYTNQQLPAAQASAAKILASAEATKTERVNQAAEEVANFEAVYAEYKKNPDIVKQRMYLDALGSILPNMELIIGKDSSVVYITGTGSITGNTASSKVATSSTANDAQTEGGESNE